MRLKDVNYLADDGIAGVAFLADRSASGLVEGPAGTGKPSWPRASPRSPAPGHPPSVLRGARRVKLYSGTTKQLRIQPTRTRTVVRGPRRLQRRFLLTRPLLEAINGGPMVLLIDE